MSFKFFSVPIQDTGQAEAELNAFLRSHKVLSIDRRWVEQGSTSFWTFCVDYLDGQATGSGGDRGARGKVDYKEVLSADEFTVFAKLRDVRKEIAQAEAVPVYTIFTNDAAADRCSRSGDQGHGRARRLQGLRRNDETAIEHRTMTHLVSEPNIAQQFPYPG